LLAAPTSAAHITAMTAAMRLPFLLLLIANLAILPARAQEQAAPFDNDLLRLAEILGALHHLRNVCGANEGQKWRSEMQALIDAESMTGDRKAKIVDSFNRGYRGFQQAYRTCTPSADIAIRRYLDEGAKIARDVTARYSN